MSYLPSAILELLLRYFGTAAWPDYSASQAVLSRNPYLPLRRRLEADWELDDLTDLQYDLGWSWWLTVGSVVMNLRVSFVGPFAVLLDQSGTRTIVNREVQQHVESEGFRMLPFDLLALPVTVWSPECEGSLYEFLFEFDRGAPWGR